MSKVAIIYWSGTGNTEAMANLIKSGAETAGAAVSLLEVTKASAASLDADAVALGCPAMGAEVLEEGDFEPFLASVETRLSGKKLALFGSYGWGDGTWMREWTERMTKAGAVLVAPSLAVNEAPAGEDAEKCKQLGASLAG
ncbi:MAG: flavodoxin [Oscillospiraceae bacterium]|jgi:flavodoxin short chain|nr:flavodoxin [Oscillospiraceae bacterium]